MIEVRPPAVAGMFYPAEPQQLESMVRDFLAQVENRGPTPKAVIVPHAGYIYSGPIAASAYSRLASSRNTIKRVILLGPAHRLRFSGLAASSAEAFATPLGQVPVDTKAVQQALQLPQVQYLDAAHVQEHSLEVHLPFLQMVLDDFKLVPFVVGDAEPAEVDQVLELFWGGPETLIVISSDLSHYHDYQTARSLDAVTSEAIESLHPQDISHEHACGRNPVNGLLVAAGKHGLRGKTIDLRNSGDTAGTKDRVVGYGAYVFL